MKHALWPLVWGLLVLALPSPLHAAKRPSKKSPHTQIVAVCRVETAPVPNGTDLIHFTHPVDGSCGQKRGHPDGGIRKLDSSALKKAA